MNVRLALASIALLLGIVAAAPARAGDYESGFGFGISVPDSWLVLTRSEIIDGAEQLFDADGKGAVGLESVSLAMRRAVYDRVRAGELEMFYRRSEEPQGFVDNVNVMTQAADLPSSSAQLAGVCRALPIEFSRIFGRPIAMDVCEMRERVGRRALYLQFDGAIPGTTTLHYQLQHGLGWTLVFTATTALRNLPGVMSDFETMIASIRLH